MGMLTTGLNKTRDFHSGNLTHIEAGTGNDAETIEDTDLQTPITGTEKTVDSSTVTSQQLVKTGTIPSTVGGGNTITEIGWKTSSPEEMGSRITHKGISHTTGDNIIYETRWFYRSV